VVAPDIEFLLAAHFGMGTECTAHCILHIEDVAVVRGVKNNGLIRRVCHLVFLYFVVLDWCQEDELADTLLMALCVLFHNLECAMLLPVLKDIGLGCSHRFCFMVCLCFLCDRKCCLALHTN